MDFVDGPIDGVTAMPLMFHEDARGWLAEMYRLDEIAPELAPAMSYVAMTRPGVTRGPHEHVHQTDCFVFLNSTFRLYLWDTREVSATYGKRHVADYGDANPSVVTIPPGVVHAYRNVGVREGFVVNFPNRLFAGEGRSGPVDEIRHDGRADSPFVMG